MAGEGRFTAFPKRDLAVVRYYLAAVKYYMAVVKCYMAPVNTCFAGAPRNAAVFRVRIVSGGCLHPVRRTLASCPEDASLSRGMREGCSNGGLL